MLDYERQRCAVGQWGFPDILSSSRQSSKPESPQPDGLEASSTLIWTSPKSTVSDVRKSVDCLVPGTEQFGYLQSGVEGRSVQSSSERYLNQRPSSVRQRQGDDLYAQSDLFRTIGVHLGPVRTEVDTESHFNV
ncbi:hypothetical protein RRG08_034514 [Elysia crispata]|uniref:Uncharacterized protein n=1 Tax=Elysia crispata TaxID=231223 RepID=A0AAE1BA80_9GAST|nr:hypothetical protein RRG08_034514 [Elysia crispata]